MKHYALLLVLLFLILSGSYIAFREFYYFGTLNLYLSEKNTAVVIDGEGEYQCPETFCSLSLFPKKYTIKIEKDSFSSQVFDITISLQKKIEKKIKLLPFTSHIEWGNSSRGDYNKGIIFPLKKSIIDKNIENFTIEKEKLYYKNIEILPVHNKIFVSTDEIGRNAWVVSEEGISQFSQKYKTFSAVLKNKIIKFYPQKNGFFSWENEKKEKFYYNGKKNIPLNLETYSLFSACKLPSLSEKTQIWASLSLFKGSLALFITNFDNISNGMKPIVFLENIDVHDIDYIECNSPRSIKGFLKSGKVFILNF